MKWKLKEIKKDYIESGILEPKCPFASSSEGED